MQKTKTTKQLKSQLTQVKPPLPNPKATIGTPLNQGRKAEKETPTKQVSEKVKAIEQERPFKTIEIKQEFSESLVNNRSSLKPSKQASNNVITERKVDLLVKVKHLELQLRHRKKRQYH